MKRVCKVALARVPLLLFLLTFALGGAGAGVVERTGAAPKLSGAVHALFDLRTPAGGPFPSDRFTVADRSHLTGRRVHLPKPNCVSRPSDCQDLDVINTLDGFNLQPRLSIPFDGPINVNTVTSRTVFLINLGSTHGPGRGGGRVIGINQVVWDPATNTLHVESDEFLDQHTSYALIVTRGVLDRSGEQIEATKAFRHFRRQRGDLREYRNSIRDALRAARKVGVPAADIAVASVFTTLSATSILEKIQDQVNAVTPFPADFRLGPGGLRTVLPLEEVTGIIFNRQITTVPSFSPVPVPIEALRIIPGAVGQIAFGKYLSPDYETVERFIPAVGTRIGKPLAHGTNEIFFNLFLPSSPMPPGGWPVAIFGHGFGDNKNNSPLAVAATMASHGIATIAINVVGHSFGAFGTLTITRADGDPVTFRAGGRGIDQDGNGTIDSTEGVNAAPPRTIIASRDGLRQTVIDLMQLVRVIQVGMDVDGDKVRDLDPSRIYYFGQSFGGIYGTMFLAVEASVHAGVPNVAGGSIIEVARLGLFRPLVGASLFFRVPPLTNVFPVNPPIFAFNENMPLRNQLPVINAVTGAIAIQEVLENTEWVSQSGNPVAYAPHITGDRLARVPAKSVIFQFAKGDQTVPNPTTTAILRAGDMAGRATYFRNDLAFAENPAVPKNPHTFLTGIGIPAVAAIAFGAQQQIAVFFASDGGLIIHPEPRRFFEVPIIPPLPEGLNFIP